MLSEYCASICHKKIEVVEARRMTSVFLFGNGCVFFFDEPFHCFNGGTVGSPQIAK